MGRTSASRAAAAITLALVLAGCGRQANEVTTATTAARQPGALLSEAAGRFKGLQRAAFDVHYNFSDPAVPDVSGTGRVDLAAERLEMDVPMQGVGELTVIQAGQTAYITFDRARWARIDLSKAIEGLSSALSGFGASPADLLGQMADTKGVERVGSAIVNGAETQHFRAHVTGPAAAGLGGAGIAGFAGAADPYLDFDAYIDADGTLRRMSFALGANGEEAFDAVMDMHDYGTAAPVEVPDAAAVVSTQTADDPAEGITRAVKALLTR